VNLMLTTKQAEEVHDVLTTSLRDLTHEIVATDNAGYRAQLQDKRRALVEVHGVIGKLLASPVPATDGGEALVRELARPGD
jgi:hypothetical protein